LIYFLTINKFLHHEAPGDPTLLKWVMERVDHFLRLDAAVLVVIFGLLILAIPVLIIGLYILRIKIPSGR